MSNFNLIVKLEECEEVRLWSGILSGTHNSTNISVGHYLNGDIRLQYGDKIYKIDSNILVEKFIEAVTDGCTLKSSYPC